MKGNRPVLRTDLFRPYFFTKKLVLAISFPSLALLLGCNSITGSIPLSDTASKGSAGIPTLAVTTSGTPSGYGNAVTFIATISSGPTGTITFQDAGSSIGTGTLNGNTATFTTATLASGAHTITASWAGDSNYSAVTSNPVTQTIDAAMPTIVWPAPTPINFGTPLGAAQLDATASVPGSFVYSPAAGAVLSSGSQTLSVTFTPTDTADYNSATASVALAVNKSATTIAWPTPAPINFGTPLGAAQLDATASVPGTFVYSPAAGTVLSSASQTLSVTFTPTDTEDYNSATASVTLAVNEPLTIITQPQDQSVAPGQPATFTVTATGATPIGYQWQRHSVSIPGATSSSYTTPPTTAGDDAADFNVVVFNADESITSKPASLVVSSSVLASFYVATNGSDNSDGSESTPFATLRRAQTAMRQSSTKITQISAGTYYLNTPLVLTALDRGETWEAVPGAVVVLSGGEIVQGWTSEGNGIYSAVAAQPVGLDLTASDLRLLPADLGYDPDRPFTSGWRAVALNQPQSDGTGNTVVPLYVLPQDLTASVKPGALVQVLDAGRYTDSFGTIIDVDATNFIVTIADPFPVAYSPGGTISWRVLGDPADLSTVGQFAVDSATGRVFFQPMNPEKLGHRHCRRRSVEHISLAQKCFRRYDQRPDVFQHSFGP